MQTTKPVFSIKCVNNQSGNWLGHVSLNVLLFSVILFSDTEGLYTDIMNHICSSHGKQFNFNVKMKQMGKKQRDAGKVLIGKTCNPMFSILGLLQDGK